MYIYEISLNSSYDEKCFRRKFSRKAKHILYPVTFIYLFIYFFENRTVYEIMWKNIVEPTDHRYQYNTAHSALLGLQTDT